MKSYMKKISTILLCIAMVMQLAACGSNQKAVNTDADDSGNNSTTTEPAKEEAQSGPVSVKVGYAYDSSFEYEANESVDNNTWTQLYEENGIVLDVLYNVDGSQKDAQMSQAVMSGNYPDFLSVAGAYYTDWANQGIFNDLTEAFEKYASEETKAYYATDVGQRALQAATLDGKLYGLPTITSPYDGMDLLWIRKDWLDQLGLEVPTTAEELFNIAKAFTENDPDGNGQNDTYGLALNGRDVFASNGGLNGFFEMFGAVPGAPSGNITFVDDGTGKAVFGGALKENMISGLTMLNQLYTNGYVSKDFVTAGSDQVNEDLGACKVGMVFGAMWTMSPAWPTALQYDENAEFIAVSIPGQDENSVGTSFYTSVPASYYCMSSQFTDYETFFKIINLGMHYLASPDTLSQADYEKYNGLEGKYTGWQCCLAPFGVPLKNLVALDRHQKAIETGDTSELNAENLRDYNSMMAYYQNKDRRSELTEDELAAHDAGLFFWSVWGAKQCGYKALKDMIDLNHFIYSAYETVPTNKMSENATTLNTLTKEFVLDVTIGNKTVNDYDSYLESWRSIGGSEVEAEADAWYQSSKN